MSLSIAQEVTITKVQQRYPWNGLVDIECNVTGLTRPNSRYRFDLSINNPISTNIIKSSNFSIIDNSVDVNNYIVSTNGIYHLVWDSVADLGKISLTNILLDISICEGVQLWADGPYWAETNIGAENPEDYGYYFWWGDTIGYKQDNDKWVASDGSSSNFSFSSSKVSTYNKNNSKLQSEGWFTSSGVLTPEHDAARAHWGENWRMPTDDEFDALCDNCTWTWTSFNGVNGYVVKGKGDYSSSSIFLPAAGRGGGTSLGLAGSSGSYWSSVPNSDTSYGSWYLYFGSIGRIVGYFDDRGIGHPVRPVSDVH